MSFIASIGGIRDVTGELKGMDLGKKMTEYGPVLRPKGLHPDKVLEALVENGYLRDVGRDTGGQRQLSIPDAYDLIDRELRGDKVYTPQDQAAADGLKAEARNELMDPEWQPMHPIARRYGLETWQKVQGFFAESGTSEETWSQQEVSDAARFVSEGMDAGDAFGRAAFLQVEDRIDPESEFPEIIEWLRRREQGAMEAFGDMPPFPDVETTDAAGQQLPEASQSLSAAVEEGQGPQDQADAGSDSAEVSGIGAVRGEEGKD